MKAFDEKIGKFIGNSDTVFIIPPFQRNYDWDEEQCEELFDDIYESSEKNKSHYIGNIVYYEGENNRAGFNEYILVDGQQRITSILLLLCAIRDLLPKEEATRLAKKFLLNEDEEDQKYRVKLKQTENDSRIFEKIIRGSEMTRDEVKSRLFCNYNYFKERLTELSEDKIVDFYNALARLDIVDLDLKIDDDLEAVQKIFEKINSTGKELSIADLIRNYLLVSRSSETQKKLYDDYWVKIENLYPDKTKISDFAEHYLITKRGVWAEEKRVYNTFKSYFDSVEMSKEEILSEILKYSKYYSWFAYENCPDDEINIIIKELNVLKSDDTYSLLLILFERMYEEDRVGLRKILDLLADFMLRYRIVSPSNGSGDIRKTLFTLLTNITKHEVELNYDAILHELSNSPSLGGRFPDDQEFKNALGRYVNTAYAKALLYKLEYKEVKNIPVDIRKATVEHLMPQTLSDEWKKYLGGEANALLVYNTYINNIGNLALLSRPLNSENSNAIWDTKKKNIENSQFHLTQTIDMNVKWNDEAIKDRCNTLTNLALKHITGPLPRDRDFETVETEDDDFSSGIYEITSIKFNVTGKTAGAVIFGTAVYTMRGWFELVPTICKILYDYDKDRFEDIVKQNTIHKSTFKTSYYLGRDPIICKEDKYLVSPYQLSDTDYYVESTLSANRALFYAAELIKNYGLEGEFKIEIR